MIKQYLLTLGLLPILGLANPVHATCWQEASKRYNIPIELLQAIAHVESSNRARVVALNSNGSLDYGFMQINDFWLPELSKYHIGTTELMDACTSVNVGAWILAQNIQQMGYNWEAVGAYGAGTKKDKATARWKYAQKVWKAMDKLEANHTATQPRAIRPSNYVANSEQTSNNTVQAAAKVTKMASETPSADSGGYRIITSKTLKSESEILAIE